MSQASWERLGQYVVSRRVALGYRKRDDFADVIDLSYRALSDLENGKRGFSSGTHAIVEQALQWMPGSIADILAGREPTEAGAKSPEPRDNSTAVALPGTPLENAYFQLKSSGAFDDPIIRQAWEQLSDPGRIVATALRGVPDEMPVTASFGSLRELDDIIRMTIGIAGQMDATHPLVATLDSLLVRAANQADALLLSGMMELSRSTKTGPLGKLADLAAIPISAWRMLINGTRPVDRPTLVRMAEVLGVDASEIAEENYDAESPGQDPIS